MFLDIITNLLEIASKVPSIDSRDCDEIIKQFDYRSIQKNDSPWYYSADMDSETIGVLEDRIPYHEK